MPLGVPLGPVLLSKKIFFKKLLDPLLKRYVITKHDPIIMCLHVCSYIPVHNGMKNEDSVLTIESLQYI